MSLQIEVPAGATARAIFETLSYENGPRVAPDAPPTVGQCHVNGVATTLTTAIAQLQNSVPATITGSYQISFATGAPNNLAVGNTVWVEVLATIAGTAVRRVYTFLVVSAASAVTPVIR